MRISLWLIKIIKSFTTIEFGMDKFPKLKDGEVVSFTSKKEIKRISLHLLMRQIFAFFNFEKGFLNSLWLVVKNPGQHIRAYLSTERDRLINPFKFYFIGASLYAFVFLKLDTVNKTGIDGDFEGNDEFKSIFIDYIQLWFLLVVFFIAYYSYIFFNKSSGYNWAENLVFNLYVMGVTLFVNSLLLPLDLVLEDNLLSDVLRVIFLFLFLVYFAYTYVSFFKGNYLKTTALSITAAIVGGITLLMTIILVGFIYGLIQSYLT